MRGGCLLLVALGALAASPGCSKETSVVAANCDDNADLCAPCSPGEMVCRGSVLKRCQQDGLGFDAVSACVTPELCVAGLPLGVCKAPACQPGDRRCEKNKMILCAPGQDAFTSFECPSQAQCEQGLQAGLCSSESECSKPEDCSGTDTECRKRSCTNARCGFTTLPKDTPVLAQKAGDCVKNVCDGNGGLTVLVDPTDIPDDKNPCTIDECRGTCAKAQCSAAEETNRNRPVNTPSPGGTACSGGVCSGKGFCGVCVAGQVELECADTPGGGKGVKTCNDKGQWDVAACEGLTPRCERGGCFGGGKLDWNDPDDAGPKPLFGIDQTEVTRADFKAWMATQPTPHGLPPGCVLSNYTEYLGCQGSIKGCDTDDCPQTCVSWCEAAGYCAAVGKRLCGKTGGGLNPLDLQDPIASASSSEWYAVCSYKGAHAYPYNVNATPTYNAKACNGVDLGIGNLEPVKSLPLCMASGVYDLSGNAAEWDATCAGIGKDDLCMIRGGSYISGSVELRCDGAGAPHERWKRYVDVGFRCCADDPSSVLPSSAIAENNDKLCSDGIDNDGNGYIDCKDFACSKNPDVTVCETKTETSNATCSDGIDNDDNGFIDCKDYGCSMNPAVTVCKTENTDAQCSDGIDNDGNGYTDCKDFSCSKNPKVTVCN